MIITLTLTLKRPIIRIVLLFVKILYLAHDVAIEMYGHAMVQHSSSYVGLLHCYLGDPVLCRAVDTGTS